MPQRAKIIVTYEFIKRSIYINDSIETLLVSDYLMDLYVKRIAGIHYHLNDFKRAKYHYMATNNNLDEAFFINV